MKAIRGAISVDANTPEAIERATRTLLSEMVARNNLDIEEAVSVFFSVTPDLNACFPASVARAMGWEIPMLDLTHMDVPGALARCLRVLIHVDRNGAVYHTYLGEAVRLRPDLEPEGKEI